MELCCSQRTKIHHKFKCFQVKLSLHGLEAQAKPHKTQVRLCIHAYTFYRYQCYGVKLIDTHCKTVAVMVSYDSILHVCELCGHEICREFLVNTIVVHMK